MSPSRPEAAAAPIFAALGDETRLRLVTRLSADGPLSIARLTEGVGVARQAVTKHLHLLAEAGVARSFPPRPAGRGYGSCSPSRCSSRVRA
jgi:DNA-binding transcriptional ArsR family regulator